MEGEDETFFKSPTTMLKPFYICSKYFDQKLLFAAYVVVPGFFVLSMPPCYPLFLFLYFIIIISLLYHYLSIYYHQYLSIYHSMLYHPGAGTGLGRISYLYCSRLIQTVHRFLTQTNYNYLKPDGHSFHSKLKSPGFESCIS